MQFSALPTLLAPVLLVACANQANMALSQPPVSKAVDATLAEPRLPLSNKQPAGNYYASHLGGDYANYPALLRFIDDMHAKYGYKREYLLGLFSQAKRKQWTLDYLHDGDLSLKAPPAKGGWTRYRAQFLDAQHIKHGVAFWRQHHAALQRANKRFGVPPEYILGIIGVETSFGMNTGQHRIIDALTTLAFDYQRRGEYFRGELEKFLLMAASENLDPAQPQGSFAGAMGYGQFMPSSYLQWAVDLNDDGHRDLWNAEDAIGSVANYFAAHGWQNGQPVVSAVKTKGDVNLQAGIDHEYTLAALQQAGIMPNTACQCEYPLRLLLLRHRSHDEFLLGHPNFYVITRYNHSSYYAMAVHELAQAIKAANAG